MLYLATDRVRLQLPPPPLSRRTLIVSLHAHMHALECTSDVMRAFTLYPREEINNEINKCHETVSTWGEGKSRAGGRVGGRRR